MLANTLSISLTLSLLLPIGLTADTSLSNDIVGCREASCPSSNGNYHCTVGQNNFTDVGLARIPDVPSPLNGLSWVKGVSVEDKGRIDKSEQNRQIKSTYYLGTPSNLNTTSLNGCAVFFHDALSKQFQQPKSLTSNGTDRANTTDIPASYGTCPDVIDQRCIDALQKRAQDVARNGTSCTALFQDLRRSSLDECSALTRTGLGNFTVTPLNESAPLTQSRNSSSDCWPVLPKSDNLTQITDHTVMTNGTATALTSQLYKITPILTVFFPANGSNSLVDSPSSQLTCLKAVHAEDLDADDADENSASLLSSNLLGGILVAALVSMI
ncbi:hypothetical protein BDV25DRAFT_161527 [Aspergillus avenaceus]|uniref:Uncharacterized protein n=1 Tax=Aspergillus avenaceus TaxID=36643 RepID=A0A5N6TKV4_ASPAV|nr:hypothetical protein BDV25DRAFT_161527 [Aspergillus avenaceus]